MSSDGVHFVQVVPVGGGRLLVSPLGLTAEVRLKDELLRMKSIAFVEWNSRRYTPEVPKSWTPPPSPSLAPTSPPVESITLSEIAADAEL